MNISYEIKMPSSVASYISSTSFASFDKAAALVDDELILRIMEQYTKTPSSIHVLFRGDENAATSHNPIHFSGEVDSTRSFELLCWCDVLSRRIYEKGELSGAEYGPGLKKVYGECWAILRCVKDGIEEERSFLCTDEDKEDTQVAANIGAINKKLGSTKPIVDKSTFDFISQFKKSVGL